MDYEHMSERLQKVLMDAANDAQSKQHPSVDTIDLLAAIFKDDILDGLFERVGIDKNRALEIIRDEEGHIASSPSQNLNFSTTVQRSLEKAEKWAKAHDETYLSVASVWLALMFNESYISKRLVREFHLNEKACQEAELQRRNGKKYDSPNAEDNVEDYLDSDMQIAEVTPEAGEVPGEAVFTSTDGIAVLSDAKLLKEQTRAKNKETLMQIIDSDGLTDEQKQDLSTLSGLCDQLKTISEKELNNELPSDDEFELIRSFGGQLERFWEQAHKDEAAAAGESMTTQLYPAALVTDVATGGDTCLELGTGTTNTLYAVVPLDGQLVLASGPVYSFYQFQQPSADRLTDAQWCQLLGIQPSDDFSFAENPYSQEDWTSAYLAPPSY